MKREVQYRKLNTEIDTNDQRERHSPNKRKLIVCQCFLGETHLLINRL